MGRGVLVVVVVLSALVFAPAAEAKRPSCYRPGWKTVIQSPKVRVFYREPPGYPDESWYYGCLRRTGKRTFLTNAYGDQFSSYGPSLFRLHGPLVAYAEEVCTNEDCDSYASTVDLRSEKEIRTFRDHRYDMYTGVADLRLAPSGSLGVMEFDLGAYGRGLTTYHVVGVTAGGSSVLDSGDDIDKSSLAIGGSWLYWTRAGQPRSAPLP